MTTVAFVSITIGVLFLLQTTPLVGSYAFRPTNYCSKFEKITGGSNVAEISTSALYNLHSVLKTDKKPSNKESVSASKSLNQLSHFLAIMGLYRQVLHNVKDKPQFANYTGFNNLRMIDFFETMITHIMRDVCEWLISYDNTFRHRPHINCTDTAELALLSQHGMVKPLIPHMVNTWQKQFGCHMTSYSDWMNQFMLPQYQPEVNFVQQMRKQE